MSLALLIDFFKKHSKFYLYLSLVGLAAGLIYFLFYPTFYIATGDLYVSREIYASNLNSQTSLPNFDYDGYYATQNASSYTGSVISMLESDITKSKVLTKLSVDVSSRNLKRLSRSMNIKKVAPQIVNIQVKSLSSDVAKTTWLGLVEEVTALNTDLNKKGDSNLVVSSLSKEPLVTATYKSLTLSIFGGILVGFFTAVFISLLLTDFNTLLDASNNKKNKKSK